MPSSPRSAALGGAVLFAAITTMIAAANADDTVLLHAAGSLRPALTKVIAAYEPTAGTKVQSKFGASGTLKDAIANGERAEVFASANMEHPQALADADARAATYRFAMFILSPAGQKILTKHGFSAPGLSQ